MQDVTVIRFLTLGIIFYTALQYSRSLFYPHSDSDLCAKHQSDLRYATIGPIIGLTKSPTKYREQLPLFSLTRDTISTSVKLVLSA